MRFLANETQRQPRVGLMTVAPIKRPPGSADEIAAEQQQRSARDSISIKRQAGSMLT
jgi:hypothetical protein